jgi:signal transduction histidine kinase
MIWRRSTRNRVYASMRQLAAVMEPGTRTLQQTLDALVHCAVQASGAVAGAMYVLDADQSLRRMASFGLEVVPRNSSRSSAAYAAPDAAYAAMAARAPIVAEGSPPSDPGGPAPPAAQPKATPLAVCMPLQSPAAALGALCGYCDEGSRPGEFELAYMSLVAAQASSALDAARSREKAADDAMMSERHRVARDLHDSVSPSLYGIGLGARTARDLLHRDAALAHQPIDYVLQLAETGLVELRGLIFERTTDRLADSGLVAALDEQVTAAGIRCGVATHAALGSEPAASMDVKQVLYHIAREALENVARHARAGQIIVRLDGTTTDLILEIADDGVGFDVNASFPGHLGLVSMHDRVAGVGGDLDITSTPGRGTQVRARVPVRG